MKFKTLAGFLLLFFIPLSKVSAQATLPQFSILSKDGINVLSWKNPYTQGISSVTIERSQDSITDFEKIGAVKNLNEPLQTFIDAKPLLGNNWYRVVVSFASGTSWISNIQKISLDSTQIAQRKPLPPNDSLQKLLASMKSLSPEQTVSNLNSTVSYPKSPYVFTNPFTGNIEVDVKEALVDNFSLHFYNSQGKEVLFVPRLNDTAIILDKRNFESSGVFSFKLLKDKKPFAKGYITIY